MAKAPSSALSELVRTLLVNPASCLTAAVIYGLMVRSDASLRWLLNPWDLAPIWWLAAYTFVRVALLGIVDGMCFLIGPLLPALPSRTGPKPVHQHSINVLDVSYLVINSTIEFVFAQQIGHLLWHSPKIARAPSAVGLLNGPAAFWLILVVDDMLYAPLHRFLHHRAVYAYVHKHHHRNTYPARGYVDAANEHPVEQILALTLHWIAVHIVAQTTGLHVVAVGAHFGFKALGACFNHTGFDLQVSFLGIDYSVRAHEMHHRKPQTNFAQYVMFWDRLMGTYRPYDSGVPGNTTGAAAAAAAANGTAAKGKGESAPTIMPEADRLPAWADPAVERATGQVAERGVKAD